MALAASPATNIHRVHFTRAGFNITTTINTTSTICYGYTIVSDHSLLVALLVILLLLLRWQVGRRASSSKITTRLR